MVWQSECQKAHKRGSKEGWRGDGQLGATVGRGRSDTQRGGVGVSVKGWLGRLFRKRQTEKLLDAEVRFHLEQRVRGFIASGMSHEEARRRANLAFRGFEQVKQDSPNARVEKHVEEFTHAFPYS